MSTAMTRAEREKFLAEPHVGTLAVSRPGKAPMLMPIWYLYEPGGELMLMTASDSLKFGHLVREKTFSFCVQSETWPNQYVTVSGPLTGTIVPADETMRRRLTERYMEPSLVEGFLRSIAEIDFQVIRMRPEQWLTVDLGKADFSG